MEPRLTVRLHIHDELPASITTFEAPSWVVRESNTNRAADQFHTQSPGKCFELSVPRRLMRSCKQFKRPTVF
jgi:hypothetical protein